MDRHGFLRERMDAQGLSEILNKSYMGTLELSKNTINKLTKIFYSDEFGMRSAALLYKEARKAGIDITHEALKKGFYDHQEVVQMFAPLKKAEPSKAPIKASFTGERVYMDTMYFPKVAIINAFDLHSKYAWGHPVRIKTRLDETKEKVSSLKAVNFFKEVEEDLHRKGITPEEVVTDFGSEFLGHFDRYLQEQGIPHTVTEVGDHLQLAPIDGYTRGLRLSAEKWLAVNPSGDLYKQIPQLIETYNNTHHSTIKITPREALTSINHLVPSKVEDSKPSELHKGDSVRIVIRYDKNPFKKIRPNWSRELYTVTKVNHVSRRFTLDNGKTYQEKDILLIPYPNKVMRSPQKEKAGSVNPPPTRSEKSINPDPEPRRSERLKNKYDIKFV
jgi:hypothetical protein